MQHSFETIRKIVKCLLKLDMCIVKAQDEDILAYLHCESQRAAFFPASDSQLLRMFHAATPNCIYEIITYLNLRYNLIYAPDYQLYLIIGPCSTEELSAKELLESLRHYQVNENIYGKIMAYCRQLPVVSYVVLQQISNLLGQWILKTEEEIPLKQMNYKLEGKKNTSLMLVDQYEEYDKIRRVEMRYELSAALNEAVKHGNLFLAYRFVQQIDYRSNDLVRTDNILRHAQNMCIITNTQLRHALEECGIHPYRLDAVSGEIARKIEKLSSISDAEAFAADIIRTYCELSQENLYNNLKPFSRQVAAYIKTHLSDNLSVKGISNILMVNPDYLSVRFHQETGLTVTEFINHERIEQAAALLKQTNLQIQQIASAVGYNNGSYFAKQFARYRCMSPRRFRECGTV